MDYFQGNPKAAEYLESLEVTPKISAFTVKELHSTVTKTEEEILLQNFIDKLETLPVDHKIAEKAGIYLRAHKNIHGMTIKQGVLAATAQEYGLTLVTNEAKPFTDLEKVIVPY